MWPRVRSSTGSDLVLNPLAACGQGSAQEPQPREEEAFRAQPHFQPLSSLLLLLLHPSPHQVPQSQGGGNHICVLGCFSTLALLAPPPGDSICPRGGPALRRRAESDAPRPWTGVPRATQPLARRLAAAVTPRSPVAAAGPGLPRRERRRPAPARALRPAALAALAAPPRAGPSVSGGRRAGPALSL